MFDNSNGWVAGQDLRKHGTIHKLNPMQFYRSFLNIQKKQYTLLLM